MIRAALLVAGLLAGAEQPRLERYVVDARHSVVGFHGSSTLHAFTGRTSAVEGEVRTMLDAPASLTVGEIRARAAALDTDNERRDKKMRELLEVGRHPEIVFRIDAAEGVLAVGAGRVSVAGELEIRGVRRARRVALDVERAGDGLRIRGSMRFDMSEHGIDPPRILLIRTDDEVEVFFDLVLAPAPAEVVAASVYPLDVVEHAAGADGPGSESIRHERLFVARDGLLWERDDGRTWIQSGPAGLFAIDLQSGVRRGPAPAAEELFADLRARLADLRARSAATGSASGGNALAAEIAAFERALAFAPATGPAQLAADGDRARITLGETTWIELDGRRGGAALAALLPALEGLPAEVLERLYELRGTPLRALVRCATPAAVNTLEIAVGEARPGELPDWAFAPQTWTRSQAGN